jgi:hypothetical protein
VTNAAAADDFSGAMIETRRMNRVASGVLWVGLVAAVIAGCGGKKTGDAAGSAPAGSAAAPAVPPWSLETKPGELMCGDKTPAVPEAAATGERAVPRGEPIGCQDQPSLDAVCACLIASSAKWASGLSAPLACQPTERGDARVKLLELVSRPTDPEELASGASYILAAAHGAKWSALAEVEHAPEVDRSATPKASHSADIKAFELRPRNDGMLVWIQSQSQYEEHAMGELEHKGAAQVTICSVPAAATQAPFCYAPIALAAWDYTYTDSTEACEIRELAVYAAGLDSTGKLTVRIDRGDDKAGAAGRYHL